MNFKNLLPKNLPFGKETPQNEYYFAIQISAKEVVGSVWGVEGKALKIINTASSDYASPAQLTDACNQVLDEALGDFQPEPTKILFGVPDSWLIDENLKDEYLDILKRLVADLDVTPMAYVSTTHAVCHLMQKQTGVPATAILIDTAGPISDLSGPLVVTIVKAGKIIGTKSTKRGGDLPQDVEKLLGSFTGIEVLPSKIAVYGSDAGALEKYKDELTSHNWMNTLPFLHLPKVEVLEEGVGIKAVSLAGASETNPNVEYTSEELPQAARKPLMSHDLQEPIGETAKEVMETAGFVSGDITQMEPEKDMDAEEAQVEERELTARPDMDDYSERSMEVQRRHAENVAEHYENEMEMPLAGGMVAEGIFKKVHQFVMSIPVLEKIPFLRNLGKRNSYSEDLDMVPQRRRMEEGGMEQSFARKSPLQNKKIGIIVGAVVVLLAVAYVFLPKAKVTIFVDPHVLEKDAQVIADPSITAVDSKNNKIPGKIITTDVTGADKGTATGTKQIGNAAKGSVVISNGTDSPISLNSGTTLTTPSGVKYTLDGSLSVASRSADLTPGKSSPVSVTASVIGPDSNLTAGSGTSLQVGNYDKGQVVAQVSSDISGGTTQNVTVVTSDDQKRLLASLASQLRQKAQTQIQAKLTGDQKILAEALNEQIQSTVYSKKVGDQASDFTLNLSIHYKGTVYSDTDLKTMVGKLVETNVPDGYSLNLADTQTQADVSKLNPDGTVVFLAKFTANLIPKIDTDSIDKQITGKSPGEAAQIIEGVQNVIGSDIQITPSIPGPLLRLPFLGSHISFNVTTK